MTAYSRFEYAREAVKLGVSSYILKHELDEDSLLCELIKLQTEIFNERENRNYIKKQALESLLSHHFSQKQRQEFSDIMETNKGFVRFCLLWFQLDRPLAPMQPPFLGIKNLYDFMNLLQRNQTGEKFFIPISDFQTVAFLNLSGLSRSDSKKEIEQTILLGKDNVSVALSQTVSVIVSELCTSEEQLEEIYHSLSEVSQCTHFVGKNQVIKEAELRDKLANGLVSSFHLEELRETLDFKNLKEQENSIEELFRLIAKDHYDMESYLSLCHLLGDRINQLKEVMIDLKGIQTDAKERIFQSYSYEEVREVILKEMNQLYQTPPDKYSKKVTEVLHFIHLNYSNQITIEEIADKLDLNGEYLNRLFKKETKKTFTQYLTDYRMRIAKSLLESGKYKIYEVADMVGYTTSQYFSMVFRKVNGMNPSDCLK